MLLERLFQDLELTLEAFAVCEVAPGWRLRLARLGWVTIHFVLAGHGRLRMPDGTVLAMTPRSLVIVPSDRAHAIESGERVDHQADARDTGLRDGELVRYEAGARTAHELIVVCGRLQARHASGLGLFDGLDGPLALDFSAPDEMVSVFERLLAEQRTRTPTSTAMTSALMEEAMILLFRRLCSEPDCPLPWLAALEDPRLSVALARMLEHPERPHTLDSLADAALMSRTTFAESFSRRFGRPPMTFLRETRMRRAARLLRGTDMTIDQVAERVGYASRSRFSHAFAAAHGATPTDYRRGLEGSRAVAAE